ncbi:hypothetical protein [Pseudanabaena sp. 'Roaring Creek']|uniref:hypothetical protein n=1 Tax=Pseudanabaena sp. 'Roaring Creek' TaxID=1681830 RepID=UPI0012E18093|nr:hypothetical protein [Pseudanabaena sp. 'Roaring Creek']
MQKTNMQKNSGSRKSWELILWIIPIGIVTIIFYSIAFCFLDQTPSLSKGVEVFSINMGIAGASLTAGGLLGFLFGIPRSESIKTQSNESNESVNQPSAKYGDNDSLEQISDWLTKILLGAGLAQISSISEVLTNLSNRIDSIISGSSLGLFGVLIFIIYVISGFAGGYLWSRFSIRTELSRRDKDLSDMIQQNVVVEVDKVRDELKKDFEVMQEIYEQIEPSAPQVEPKQEEEIVHNLKALFCDKASERVRLEVFRQIQDIRSQNWENNKLRMAKTIPVFKALIKAETDSPVFKGNFHRVLAELGFAIKDKANPNPDNYKEAKAFLDKAIKERDKEIRISDMEKRPWLAYYEFNYIYCIFGYMSDEQLSQDSNVRNDINRKLEKVYKAKLLKNIFDRDQRDITQRIRAWSQSNTNNVIDIKLT